MTKELEPCPFCNGQLSVNQDEDGWCRECPLNIYCDEAHWILGLLQHKKKFKKSLESDGSEFRI